MHSNLWDLSDNCTVSRRVSDAFAHDYYEAIGNTTRAVRAIVPARSRLFWRTATLVSSNYDRDASSRTRQSQIVLNHAVRAGALASPHQNNSVPERQYASALPPGIRMWARPCMPAWGFQTVRGAGGGRNPAAEGSVLA